MMGVSEEEIQAARQTGPDRYAEIQASLPWPEQLQPTELLGAVQDVMELLNHGLSHCFCCVGYCFALVTNTRLFNEIPTC